MEFKELESERLRLVKITEKHTESYYDIMSRDEVTRYYGMDSLTSKEQAENILKSFQTTFENMRGIRWGIILKATDEFIGTVGLNNLSVWSRRTEIGYELHPDYWGKGITTEAVKEVLRYSFAEMGLNRVGAVTYPQNSASFHLLERLGFKKEGTLRGYLYQNQHSHDALVFSLLRTDYVEETV